MKTNCFKKYLGGVLIFLLCAAIELHAQARGGGGGGSAALAGSAAFGGGGGGGGGGSASSSQYNNNGTVGSANISVDPVTHNIIVIADKADQEQIQQGHRQPRRARTAGAHQGRLRRSGGQQGVRPSVFRAITPASAKTFRQITGYVTNFTVANPGTSQCRQPLSVQHHPDQPERELRTTTLACRSPWRERPGMAGCIKSWAMISRRRFRPSPPPARRRCLSRPSILARDGQMAEIVVGQSIYLPSSVSLHRGRRQRHHRSDHQRHLSKRRHPTGRHAVHRGEQSGANDSPAANHVH